MAIPEFASFMNPVMAALKSLGGSGRPGEVCAFISEQLKLPDDLLDKRVKRGLSRYENQVYWARFYLTKAGYLDSSVRGVWTLTRKGERASELSEDQLMDLLREVRRRDRHVRAGRGSSRVARSHSRR